MFKSVAFVLAGAVLAPGLCVAAPGQFAVEYTNGMNARYVVYGEGGKSLGAFTQKKGDVWEQTDRGGKLLFSYKEQKREQFAVELVDASRNVRVRLDLKTNKIAVAEGDGPMTDKYEMLYAGSSTR